MQTFGSYKTVRELSRSGLACLYVAEPVDGGSTQYAIKALQPPTDFLDEGMVQRSIDTFIECAETQRRVAGDSEHWAHIYDVGRSEGAAYYATDLFPRSVEKLIRSRARLSSADLKHLIESILHGLADLHTIAGRAHGDLKASNILISGEDIASPKAKIALADPAPMGDVLARGGEEGDLNALGNLLHQLVLHRPFEPMGAWPIPDDPAWRRVGNGWRQLCTELLNPGPQPEREGSLATFYLSRVNKLIGAKTRARRTLVVAVAALVLIVGGLLVYFQIQMRGKWVELCQSYSGWQTVQSALENSNTEHERYKNDDSLKRILSVFDSPDLQAHPVNPARIVGQTEFSPALESSPPLGWSAYNKTHAALTKVKTLNAALESWPLRQKWMKRQQDDQQKHFVAPARFLEQLLAPLAPPRKDVDLGAAISGLLDLEQSSAQFAQLETVASQIETDRAAIEHAGEPLSAFGKLIEKTTDDVLQAQQPSADRKLELLSDRMSALRDLAHELALFVGEYKPDRYDVQRMASEWKPANPGTVEAYQAWLKAVKQYQLIPPAEVAQAANTMDQSVEAVKANFARLRESSDAAATADLAQYQKRLDELAPQIAQFRQRKWVAKDQGALSSQLQPEVAKLANDVSAAVLKYTVRPDVWISQLGLSATHPAVSAAWDRKQKELLAGRTADQLKAGSPEFKQLQDSVAAWKTLLASMDKAVPREPTVADAFKPAVASATARAVDAVVASVADNKTPKLPSDALDRFTKDLGGSFATIEDASKQAEVVRAALDAGNAVQMPVESIKQTPVDWAQTARQQIEKEPALAAALKPLVDRIEGAAKVETLNRADLLALVNDPKTPPEVGAGALRRLLQLPLSSLDEFKAESELRAQLDTVVARFAKGERRTELTRALSKDAPRRWADFLNHFSDASKMDEALASALAGASAFDVKDTRQLSPPMTYNLELRQIRSELSQRDGNAKREDLQALTKGARARIEKLPAAIQKEPVVLSFLQALHDYDEGPPPAMGPAAPWVMTQGGQVRQYTAKIRDVDRTLEFVLVTPSGGTPFYLGTSEVPEGVFAAIANTNANFGNEILATLRTGLGPKVMRFSREFEQEDYWLPDAQQFPGDIYARELQDGFNHLGIKQSAFNHEPSPAHPMQQISANAATHLASLLGCRIPTDKEWLAAYQTFEANGSDRNLRDATWRLQFAKAANSPENIRSVIDPAAGIFLPANVRDSGNTYNLNDRTLWFRKVEPDDDAKKPGMVYNLVGNVAEFVSGPNNTTCVIGGSALSPPEIQVDKPYAVPNDALGTRGYSDVGLRLAFTAALSEIDRLRSLLAQQQYLVPASAAKPPPGARAGDAPAAQLATDRKEDPELVALRSRREASVRRLQHATAANSKRDAESAQAELDLIDSLIKSRQELSQR
jgi:serine/threonine protein kinase